MCKLNKKNKGRRIDPCMKSLIHFLKAQGWETKGCCCGHGKYPLTCVVKRTYSLYDFKFFELFTNIEIPRKTRFYVRDKQGYYYIPEVLKCQS